MLSSVRSTILSELNAVAEERVTWLPPLTDDLVLADTGLDSLFFAVLVSRLEDKLGSDPFTVSDDIYFPVTLGDFIAFYEAASSSSPNRARASATAQ